MKSFWEPTSFIERKKRLEAFKKAFEKQHGSNCTTIKIPPAPFALFIEHRTPKDPQGITSSPHAQANNRQVQQSTISRKRANQKCNKSVKPKDFKCKTCLWATFHAPPTPYAYFVGAGSPKRTHVVQTLSPTIDTPPQPETS